MAKLNVKTAAPDVRTHEGAKAYPHLKSEQILERSVASCLLWEGEFYEDGTSIAERIEATALECPPTFVANLAKRARGEMNLRHVPLLLLACLAKTGSGKFPVADTIYDVIQRADELAEFLSIYWRNGKRPLSAQVKKGLARAFTKFDAYQIAKYDRASTVRLRDVLFLVHAKPNSPEQEKLWKELVEGNLSAPDTWEVGLSTGEDKKETWERLLRDNNLGFMALLRNLRNMLQVGVDETLIRNGLEAGKGAHRVLPFRYVAAAKSCPDLEDAIDKAMLKNLEQAPKLPGKTIVAIDVSGSMYGAAISENSVMDRAWTASALGALARELCENPKIYATAGDDGTRIHTTEKVPARRGMALVDAIYGLCRPLGGGGIFLNQVVNFLKEKEKDTDRIIVITDEQDCAVDDRDSPALATPFGENNYLINVASYKNGIGYGKWTHIDGFSDAIFRYIHESERITQSRN